MDDVGHNKNKILQVRNPPFAKDIINYHTGFTSLHQSKHQITFGCMCEMRALGRSKLSRLLRVLAWERKTRSPLSLWRCVLCRSGDISSFYWQAIQCPRATAERRPRVDERTIAADVKEFFSPLHLGRESRRDSFSSLAPPSTPSPFGAEAAFPSCAQART